VEAQIHHPVLRDRQFLGEGGKNVPGEQRIVANSGTERAGRDHPQFSGLARDQIPRERHAEQRLLGDEGIRTNRADHEGLPRRGVVDDVHPSFDHQQEIFDTRPR
jgi:hypothetical protein